MRLLFFLIGMVLIIGSSLLLFSCNHLDEGVVMKKVYEPENTYMMFIPLRIGKVTTLIPYMIHDNEDFMLVIDGTDKDGEERHETVYVSKECYASTEPGMTWHKTQDCSFSDDNNSKERK